MGDNLKDIFRSETSEEMPLLDERIACLRDAGQILVDVSKDTLTVSNADAKKAI